MQLFNIFTLQNVLVNYNVTGHNACYQNTPTEGTLLCVHSDTLLSEKNLFHILEKHLRNVYNEKSVA